MTILKKTAKRSKGGGRPAAPFTDLLGAHVSAAGGVDLAPENARALRCSAFQLFTRNQRQWKARPIEEAAAARFRAELASCGAAAAISHASYLLNLAAGGPVERLSRATLLDEWDRAEQLGLQGVCFHPGAHLGGGERRGIERVASALNRIAASRPRHGSLILIENTAGQGTCLGRRFEELAEIFVRLERPESFGLCIDTCHLFAAGYDLRDEAAYERTFAELESILGLERIAAFHLNDSGRELGSRVDRHAGIGKGKLGKEAFRLLVNDPRFRRVPKILETPGGDAGYRRELKLLRSLLAEQKET
jgi:deoxyribonuclease-4